MCFPYMKMSADGGVSSNTMTSRLSICKGQEVSAVHHGSVAGFGQTFAHTIWNSHSKRPNVLFWPFTRHVNSAQAYMQIFVRKALLFF